MTHMLSVGSAAPDFCLPGNAGEVCLSRLRGRWVVLYFYPKDNTSGCTMEALEFTALDEDFKAERATVLGVSADSVESHARFREKHSLSHGLLSDEEKRTLVAYGVWQTKKMYGREFKGVVRSTYLIDPRGAVAHAWAKVRPEGHAEEVLARLRELKK